MTTHSDALVSDVLPTSSLPAPVWLVDDDPDDQVFIRSAFGSLHPVVSVRILNDGESLFAYLGQANPLPKLVVLDLNMPRMNGYEVLRQMRNEPSLADLPVVILTTSSEPSDQRQALALGANQFFTKPVSYPGLVSLIQIIATKWLLR